MSAELCRVGLWLEALEPGKPLSFLDHHIRVGNSLLGTTPALLAAGIPDDPFTAIEGDIKAKCAELKRDNKRERNEYKSGQGYLFDPPFKLGNLASELARIDTAADDTAEQVADKARRYSELVTGSGYQYGRLLADTWCAAFVWKKDDSELGKLCPTERDFRKVESHAAAGLLPHVREDVQRLARQYQCFHWHLAFPDVFQIEGRGSEERASEGTNDSPRSSLPYSLTPSSGFDVVLGNPPWEHTELKEKEWFAERCPEIANAPTGAARKRLIESLRERDPTLFAAFSSTLRHHDCVSHFLGNSARFPLCGRGRINVYTVFAESMRTLVSPTGRSGCVLPSGIATDDTTKFFFQDVVETHSLVSLFDFENRAGIFPAVDSRMKFCLFTTRSPVAFLHSQLPTPDSPPRAEFVFFAHQVEDLADPDRRFTLSAEEIALLNPNTRTCPIFRSRRDAELTKSIYRHVPVLIREARDGQPEENPWGIKFKQGLFNMTSDSHLFRTREQLESDGWTLEGNVFRKREVGSKEVGSRESYEEYLPLYEAKMAAQYDHRAADVVLSESALIRQAQPDRLALADHEQPDRQPLPRYWVRRDDVSPTSGTRPALLGFTDVTSPTNERTMLATAIPIAGVGHTLPLVLTSHTTTSELLFYACLNSFAFDYTARQKVGGIHFTYFILKQLPNLPPENCLQRCPWSGPESLLPAPYSLSDWLLPRVLELTYTAWDLEPFARDCGYAGPPFRWDEERRFLLRAELDAAFFHLYLPADEQAHWLGEKGVRGEGVRNEGPDSLVPDSLLASFPTPRDAVSYIMDTFPIVRRKDEEKYNGDYRTKRVILEIYDAMQASIRTGHAYQTRLNPPPADPRVSHPSRETKEEEH